MSNLVRIVTNGCAVLSGIATLLSGGLIAFMVYNPRFFHEFFHARIYKEGFSDLWRDTVATFLIATIVCALACLLRQWMRRDEIIVYEIPSGISPFATTSGAQ